MLNYTTGRPTVAISDLDSTEAVTLSDDLIVDQPDATRKATLSSVLASLGIMRCIFFSEGGTLESKKDIAFFEEDGTFYSYTGTLPVTVPAGFNPIGNADWKPQTDPNLREELSSLTQTQYTRRQSFKNSKGRKFSVYNGGVWTGTDATNDKLSPTDTVFYRLPQIIKLPSGTLVAFCNELHGNSTDIGATADQQCNLVMKYSSDNGVTWSSKVTIADFGATYQNGETNCMYNHVDGRIYVFFTSCKGQTGWGYSQAGTLDPSLSSQIYYTYCEGEAFNWVTPINITSLFKTNSDSFAWTSPVRGAVLPDGTMAFVVSTLDTASPVNVTSHLIKWRGSELISKTAFLSNPDSGGEVGIHLENTGTLIAHSRAYPNGVGQQKFFRSDINHTTWTHLSTVATTDVKGDLVILSDGSENNPLYALTIANGNDDAGSNRSYYRVFFSRDLVTWAKSPVTGVHEVYVGYTSSIDVGDGDSIVSVTEGGGPFGVIWFTWTSQNYLRGRTYALGANAVPEIASTDKAGLIPTGAIPNYSIFRNSTTGAFSLAVNGSEVPFKQTATTTAAWNAVTKTYTGSSSDTTVDVTGVEFILINAPGNVTLNGLTGGYIGQRVMVLSAATGGNIDLIRQSGSVSATDRIYYSLSESFNTLRVSFTTKMAVTLVRTPIGWVSTDVANITI